MIMITHTSEMLSQTKYSLAETAVKNLTKVSCSSSQVKLYLKQLENSLTLKPHSQVRDNFWQPKAL